MYTEIRVQWSPIDSSVRVPNSHSFSIILSDATYDEIGSPAF